MTEVFLETRIPVPMALQKLPRILVSGMGKSSGKTLLTLGLAGAFAAKGLSVQLFKKGPDYIDPLWHRAVTGRESYNLDSYLMGEAQCRESFLRHSAPGGIHLVEGNLGLHDGLNLEGENSSAALAKLLQAPVLLIVDSTGMNRNLAALVFGMQRFDPDVTVGGVVLNRVKSTRQEQKQIQAIEHYCGIPVVGSIPRGERPLIPERHMGLVTPQENGELQGALASMVELVSQHVSLDAVEKIAREAPPLMVESGAIRPPALADVRLGVAYDPAFCFYYRENLDALEAEGAKLVYFDLLKEPTLPEVDGLYLAGGFPESFLPELEANGSMRRALKERIESGLPVYAECGGMMLLTRSIIRDGVTFPMAGVIPADVQFQPTPAGYGYVELSPGSATSWLEMSAGIRGHEFHYSKLINTSPELEFLYEVKRGTGMGQGRDGIVYKNLLASYVHLHARGVPHWAQNFVAIMRAHQSRQTATGNPGRAAAAT